MSPVPRAADRVARLQAVTAALSGALTPAQVAAVVVEQGVAALGARAGSVALLTADDALFVTVAVKVTSCPTTACVGEAESASERSLGLTTNRTHVVSPAFLAQRVVA